jgi:hypothetical protein
MARVSQVAVLQDDHVAIAVCARVGARRAGPCSGTDLDGQAATRRLVCDAPGASRIFDQELLRQQTPQATARPHASAQDNSGARATPHFIPG